jgi:hypothetical protein
MRRGAPRPPSSARCTPKPQSLSSQEYEKVIDLIFDSAQKLLAYQVPCGRLIVFSSFSPLFSLAGAAGLRGTFPGHPRPPKFCIKTVTFLDNIVTLYYSTD